MAPFDSSLIEQKQGKSYIGQEFIRERLIEATGNCFDFAIQSIDYRNDGALRDRTNQNTGEVTPAPNVCVVIGTLTIPGLGSRTDIGVQEMEAGSGADSSYKGAASDCLKRCAAGFGVALKQLYIDTSKPGQQAARNAPAPRQTRQQSAPPQQAPNPAMVDRDTFAKDCVAAFVTKDGPTLTKLTATAGDSPELWALMVKGAQDVRQIDWVADKMEKKGVGVTDVYTEAARARRKELE